MDPDATPWYLRPVVNPAELVLDAGDGSVKAGTVPALIERLTAQDNTGTWENMFRVIFRSRVLTVTIVDMKFVKTFMMTWKSFSELDELFELLTQRYWIEPPEGLRPAELEEWRKLKQQIVRTRVLNTFKTLVTDEDDVLDTEDHYIYGRIKHFLLRDDVAVHSAAKPCLMWVERAVSFSFPDRKKVFCS
jgi:son of sevenless